MKNQNIIKTSDGSHTMISSEFRESYHSKHGAIQESQHVFIDAGLAYVAESKNEINLLEIGFGSGLNALMTFLAGAELGVRVHYTTYEKFPIRVSDAAVLNYPTLLHVKDQEELFLQFHKCEWNVIHEFNPSFYFEKRKQAFESLSDTNQYDLVYYDAFGPGTQADLWEIPMLEKIANSLKANGVFVTYCAKGSFKRNLKSLGFEVEALPGPPGKREMTRGRLIRY